MNKTKIEYVDFTINPIKGLCKNNCWYCYAKKMYKRFKWDEKIKFDPLAFLHIPKNPSRIFVGSMHDIFGKWIPHYWIQGILDVVKNYEEHTFIFLTKNPSRYKEFVFPQNCWLGTSVENNKNMGRLYDLYLANDGRNKTFVSYEPLLSKMEDIEYYAPEITRLDWVIIGGLTPKPVHKYEWVMDIVNDCRLCKIPIFLKDNLKYPAVIKEWPE
jgi:protein gp37